MSRTLAQTLADFTAELTFEHLPSEVVHSLELRVLDTLGICLASRHFGLADGVQHMVDEWGGTPRAHLVGGGRSAPAPNAALVNGTLAHSLDFDDTHLPSVLHPSASIVPAVLAVAESAGRSGREALIAAAAGIEVTVRLGMAGYLPDAGNVYFERGWHATSICGALGSAVACARLLGLDASGILDALGIAASFGSGVIEGNRAGGTVKRVHCGWAAHAGITAASLAQHGMTGPPTALEGRFGVFEAFLSGQFDPKPVAEGLLEHWELPGILFKPYPANHYTHAGIDAALAIRRQLNGKVDVDQVEHIELGAAASALRTIGEPRDEKIRPRSGYHAQFSGPFTVATALLGGGGLGVYFEDFTDATAADPDRLALAAKVTTVVDAECDMLFPRAFPAVLRVYVRDGRVLEERVMHNRVLSDAEVRRKFELNAAFWLQPSGVERVAERVFNLAHADHLGDLLAATDPENRAPA
ncbi:MAG: MmgE/PrpD family protein [Chloroflexi bacterium]|nr:MmgE/PrpD family protein [Chloroflexota bacterium]